MYEYPKYDPVLSEKWRYEDPHAKDQGILLSNRIHELCEQKLLIEEGYQPENLRPASYTLKIGDDYIDSEGNKRSLSDEEDTIVFKKNSIVFVSTKEKLSLPYYVIARFNLRVNWVYDGILLGTGPQVDPGFAGYLSCPLYNLTNSDITIRRGQDFATIDFEKTTALIDDKHPEAEMKALIQKAVDKRQEPFGNEVYSFYKLPALKRLQNRKSHAIISSLIEMREEVQTWRRLGVGSLVAFFGLTLSLLAFGANLYRQNTDLAKQNADLAKQNADLTKQVTDGKDALGRTSERITKLEEAEKRLEGLVVPTHTTPPLASNQKGHKPGSKVP
jgi:deoxycytidine triphosphate deaminase